MLCCCRLQHAPVFLVVCCLGRRVIGLIWDGREWHFSIPIIVCRMSTTTAPDKWDISLEWRREAPYPCVVANKRPPIRRLWA